MKSADIILNSILWQRVIIEGTVKNSDGSNAFIDDLELRIIPPNQNTSIDISLSEFTPTTIKDVDFEITPKRKTFLIKLTPQSNQKIQSGLVIGH